MSANGNIEKFIIELGFADSKAVQGLKKFLKDVDKIGAKLDRLQSARSNSKAALDEAHVKARGKHLDRLYREGQANTKRQETLDRKALERRNSQQVRASQEDQRRTDRASARRDRQAERESSNRSTLQVRAYQEDERRNARAEARRQNQIQRRSTQQIRANQEDQRRTERTRASNDAAAQRSLERRTSQQIAANREDQRRDRTASQRRASTQDAANREDQRRDIAASQRRTSQQIRANQEDQRRDRTASQRRASEQDAANREDRRRTQRASEVEATARSNRARALVSARRRARNTSGQGALGEAISEGRANGMQVRRDLARGYITGDTAALNALRASIRRHNRGLAEANRRTRSLNFSQRALGDSTRNMARQYLSVFALFEGTRAINRIGQDFEGMRASMLLSSGSAAQATKDLAFVNGEAKRLGLNLKDATDGFTKFQLSAKGKLDRGETRQLFTGFSEFATAAGVDKFRYEKGLQAIQQMMNKGQIMAEELKNQLAEQIPGSLQAFEKALGVTSSELFDMMERGELMAEDVLPKVGLAMAEMAREGGALDAQLASTRVAQGRFTTFAQEGADTIFTNGYSQGFASLLRSLSEGIGDSSDGLKGLGKAYQLFFNVVEKASEILIPIVSALFSVIGGLSEAFMSLFSTNLGRIVVGITTITLAVARLAFVTGGLNAALMTMITRLLLIPYLVIGVAHEIQALFDDSLTGTFEKYALAGKQTGEITEEEVSDKIYNGVFLEITAVLSRIVGQFTGGSPTAPPPSSTASKQERGQLDINITSSDSNVLSTIQSNNLDTFVTSG
jgi:tape measure domain-containing protein